MNEALGELRATLGRGGDGAGVWRWGVRGAVGCAWRWGVRSGGVGVWRGACGGGEKFEGARMTGQKVSLVVLDAWRVTAL